MCIATESSVFVYKGGNQKVPKDVARVRIDPPCKKIERSAFARCKKLVDLEFSEGLEQIGFSAFYCCSSLEFIRLPSTTRIIGNMAFAGCIRLKHADLNDGLEQIKVEAFSRCSSLEKASMPATVVCVGKGAFANCPKLGTVTRSERLGNVESTNECKTSEPIENDKDGNVSARQQLNEASMTWTSMTSIGAATEDDKGKKGILLRNQLNKRLSMWKLQPKQAKTAKTETAIEQAEIESKHKAELEAEEKRKLEEFERLTAETELTERLKAEEYAKKQALEGERKQKVLAAAVRRRTEAVETARLKAQAEEAERLKAEEEAAMEAQRKLEEAARLQFETAEVARLKADEESKKQALDEERKQQELEEAARLQAEAEETVRSKRKADEETACVQALEEEARQLQVGEYVDGANKADLGDWADPAMSSKAKEAEMKQLRKETKWNTELTKALQGTIMDRDEEVKALRKQIEDGASDYEAKLAMSSRRTEEAMEQMRTEMKQSLDSTKRLHDTILNHRDEEISTLRTQLENAEVKLITLQMDFETFKTESFKMKSFAQIQSEEDKEASRDYWWMDEFD